MKTIMTSVNQSWTKQSQRVPCQLNTRRLSKVRTRTVEAGLMLVMYLLVLPAASGQARSVFNDCGGHLTAPQGIIQSPNFPRPFPVPISCRWVIHVPADSKTVIYFTQYYLRHSFFITEYDYYSSPKNYRNKILVGEIDAEDLFSTVVAYRPYVVLDLVLTDDSNAHLRVEEYLMDVHGFNISYHLVPQDSELQTVPCSVEKCSYLGHCLASADFSEFSCVCFDGFHGPDCERGPYCDPDKGQNMCLNGGNCRYFYGSLVNACECPAGFNGPMCEEETSEVTQEECARLKCSQRCDFSRDTMTLHCACNKGFKLAQDGATCMEEEHYRVMVDFPVVPAQSDLVSKLEKVNSDKTSLADTATTVLHMSDLSTARDFTISLISETTLEFVFTLRKEELSGLDSALSNLVRDGNLFDIAVEVNSMSTDVEPEMKLLSLESDDEGPAFEGKLMVLVCSARGSDDLRFQWFKDGRPFNVSLTNRNAWQIRPPETIGEKHISTLNMDGVTTYDRGEFTCVISDLGQTMNQSIVMDVLPYPQVEVTPITVSAVRGSTQTFRCWSLDEIQRKFTYSWRKNGRPLTDADDEIVEDLRPRGSRLLVRNAQSSTNYTCCVTNKAGTSQRSGHMFVAPENQSALACPNSALDGVKWNRTFAGFFNLQKCPTDAAESTKSRSTSSIDLVVRRLGDGYTSRRCTCNSETEQCTWGLPNYARCQSVYLIEIYDMLMNIKLGYQVQPLMSVYQKLFSIACQARDRMFAGDLDITAKNLYMVVTMATDFPSLVGEEFAMKDLVEFLNILLEEAATVTEEEKQQLFVGGRLIQMAESLQALASKDLLSLQEARASTVEVTLVTKKPVSVKERERLLTKVGPRGLDASTGHKPRVRRNTYTGETDGSRNVLLVRYDHAAHPLLDRGPRYRHPEETFVSDVFSLVPVQTKESSQSSGRVYLVDIPHRSVAGPTTLNKTYCLSWEGWTRELPTGRWVSGRCVVVQTKPNMTTCLCPLPGHFTVVMVPTNLTAVEMKSGSTQKVLLITCVVSLACLTLALVIYLMAARFLMQSKHMIHFSLIVSVVGVNLICVLCLVLKDTQMMCVAGKIVLQFFTVSAFTFLVLDVVLLYLDIHARTHTRINIGLPKFLLMGWGFPVVSVVCGILVMEVSGQDRLCHTWCWWTSSHKHFYTVVVPLVCLIVGHSVLMGMSVIMMYHWHDEYRDIDRRKFMMDIGRVECLLLLLTAFSLMSTTITSDPSNLKQLAVVILNVLLTLSTILFLVIFKKPMREAVLSLCCPAKESAEKSIFSEYPAIPGKPTSQSHAALEAQKIHDYCETVDRERYTNEHKRQLRTLIRSSSSAGSFSAGAFSAPLGLTTCSTEPRLASSRTCDSAAEAVSFGRGYKRRKKYPSTRSTVLRPEPSISRLLDSDYSKPVIERGSSVAAGIAEEDNHVNSVLEPSFLPMPIVQKSWINKSNQPLQKHKDNGVAGNTQHTNHQRSSSRETKTSRSSHHSNKTKGPASKDTDRVNETNPSSRDALVKTPSAEQSLKKAEAGHVNMTSAPRELTVSVVDNVKDANQRESQSLLEGEAESEKL